MMTDRKQYTGPTKVVIAFDVGTTHSAISYAILEQGRVPEIQRVDRFPGHEHSHSYARVPSVLYYDSFGGVRLIGGTVSTDESVIERAEDEGWMLAEWWKLHDPPKHLLCTHIKGDDIPPLPSGKSVEDVLTDFLRYLFHCTYDYIKENHDGFDLDSPSIKNSTEFVLPHPNGWDAEQQQCYRQAVERAGFVPTDPGGISRVHLIREGEASLRYCLSSLREQPGNAEPQGVAIIDAGGGVIDCSMYSMTFDPFVCEEMAPPECCLQGSVFVTRRAVPFLQRWTFPLVSSKGRRPEILVPEIADLTRKFDEQTKPNISSIDETVCVKISDTRCGNSQYNVEHDILALSGEDATGLFDDSIQAIIDAFEKQFQFAKSNITMAFLVGGFARSHWLWTRLQSYFKMRGIQLCRLEDDINKAAAHGAVLSQVDRDHPALSRFSHDKYAAKRVLLNNQNDLNEMQQDATAKIMERGDGTLAEQTPGQEKVGMGRTVAQNQRLMRELGALRRLPACKPYRGLSPKLVIAFDVGTTYSAVSYCVLDPGEIPEIRGVSRYLTQENAASDNKIPSILYYDCQGAVRAVGAEALQLDIVQRATEENWIKVEWWKLHLRPRHLASSHIRDEDIPPLPPGKSAIQVLGDFMRYLFSCTREYITRSHASGTSMWNSMENDIEFILTHPNGWEGLQQQQIRQAAEIAGLIPSGEHADRIHLVMEGEASLYFCITRVLAPDSLSRLPISISDDHEDEAEESEQQGIVIIDAGGGTVDLSAYSVKPPPSREFKEIAPGECRLEGSVFVTQRAQTFLEDKLVNSRYGSPNVIRQMKQIFDKTTKPRFSNAADPQYIKFGTVLDTDPQYDIWSGQLKMAGEEVAKFFEPSVAAIADAFKKQQRAATQSQIRIKHAFLVGGYAASDFLYRRLQQHPVFSNVYIWRHSSDVNKAAAIGAMSSYVDPLVTSRTSRYTYGITCTPHYDPSLADHKKREHTKYTNVAGETVLPNGFAPILKKGVQVSEQQEFRSSFSRARTSRSELTKVDVAILAYRGDLPDPQWEDDEPTHFTTLCRVVADTSQAAASLRPQKRRGGKAYFCLCYDMILLFGLAELKALISWKYEGVEKRSPASIVYD